MASDCQVKQNKSTESQNKDAMESAMELKIWLYKALLN